MDSVGHGRLLFFTFRVSEKKGPKLDLATLGISQRSLDGFLFVRSGFLELQVTVVHLPSFGDFVSWHRLQDKTEWAIYYI